MNREAGKLTTRSSTHLKGPVPLEDDHSTISNTTLKIAKPPTEEASKDESVSLDFQVH